MSKFVNCSYPNELDRKHQLGQACQEGMSDAIGHLYKLESNGGKEPF